jgi:NADPH2:quinone reductase
MRAVVCRRHGDYREMTVEEIPTPAPGPGQLLVEVGAAGVSFANILAVAGKHQNRTEPPFTPGTEVAGIVASCGEGVSHVVPGQRVIAAVRNGGYATHVLAHAITVAPIPESLAFAEATLFPTNYATAYTALATEARIEAGEVLLVHGAAGASGMAAVEMGKALGAEVIACASTADKREMAMRAGAAHAVSPDSFRDEVLEITKGRGADVVFDPVGGAVFAQSIRCTAPQGRILVIGFASGEIPSAPANLLLVKNIAVMGVYFGYYTGWARQQPDARALRGLRRAFEEPLRCYERGELKPVVHAGYPLTGFAQAMQVLEDRKAVGKIVLEP